jgi:hypothetical protein
MLSRIFAMKKLLILTLKKRQKSYGLQGFYGFHLTGT